MPRNATVRGDGFRMYQWPGGDSELHRLYGATEPSDVLSVTSIKTLAGEHYRLVNWKIANVINSAMGVRKHVITTGKRGAPLKRPLVTYRADGPFPGEFVTRMLESEGRQGELDDTRAWLRARADEPRDIAAVRGSVVHKMIEYRADMATADEAFVRQMFERQWAEERRKIKPETTGEDIAFATNALRQYWHMRQEVPFVVLAQEPQVWNLTAGYAGSADVFCWFLGTFDEAGNFTPVAGANRSEELQRQAYRGEITLEEIEDVGGTLALGDWKTSNSVLTSHVIQVTAYLAAEFVGSDGQIDERLTNILRSMHQGAIIHIRPDHASVDFFDFRADVLRGFYGSVAYARFLAYYKEPDALFTHGWRGEAPDATAVPELDEE